MQAEVKATGRVGLKTFGKFASAARSRGWGSMAASLVVSTNLLTYPVALSGRSVSYVRKVHDV